MEKEKFISWLLAIGFSKVANTLVFYKDFFTIYVFADGSQINVWHHSPYWQLELDLTDAGVIKRLHLLEVL